MAPVEPSTVVFGARLVIFFFMSLKRVDEAPFSAHGPAIAAGKNSSGNSVRWS
ncbi:hypothetical protein ALQ20_103260 [Pseudomonas syringae pv. atrofaciens]|nr:hypothetical protein ALQ20_103260 [Pseudomonas syringae pv. atrofaciens]